MKEKKYCGVVVPMVTPVTPEGRLDKGAVERITEFFAKAKVSPLLMGTTGEGNSVSHEDGLLFVETAVKARNKCSMFNDQSSMVNGQRSMVNGQRSMVNDQWSMTIYAGLTGNCFSEQLAQAEAYVKAGADVIVATLPTYYALTPEQMENYYCRLADHLASLTKPQSLEASPTMVQSSKASPTMVPLMLYNILATTHMSIPVEVIKRLSNHPNIVGLKDSERDLERMAQCIDIARGREDFCYFCGWAAQSAHSLEMGGDGIVPSTGNYVPEMFRQLYEAAVSGDMDTANRLQDETNEIAKIYQKDRTLGQSLTALKVMMQTKGLCGPDMLMPLTRLSTKEEQAIVSKLQSIKL
jgi:4-hydroxy-tetrahydrodipicolinate synthase